MIYIYVITFLCIHSFVFAIFSIETLFVLLLVRVCLSIWRYYAGCISFARRQGNQWRKKLMWVFASIAQSYAEISWRDEQMDEIGRFWMGIFYVYGKFVNGEEWLFSMALCNNSCGVQVISQQNDERLILTSNSKSDFSLNWINHYPQWAIKLSYSLEHYARCSNFIPINSSEVIRNVRNKRKKKNFADKICMSVSC